jgi:hypothetical protein
MDIDLLILISITIFAIWFLSVIVRYIDSFNQLPQQEQEKRLFGKTLRPETRYIVYGFIGGTTKNTILFIALTVLVILAAKYFGATD